jgi:hypothetical protein
VKSTHRSIVKVCLFCCAVLLLSSCSWLQGNTDTEGAKDVQKLSCLIVLPTETPVDTDKKMDYAEARNLRRGAAFMDGVIAEELKNFPGSRLLNTAQVEGLTTGIISSKMDMIKKIGKELKCDAILTSTITRFHQREGGEYAADYPASASFTMELTRVADGRVLWRGNFDETQESLLSNLLSFGKAQSRGFKWITVEDLVRQGIHERLSSCPYLK